MSMLCAEYHPLHTLHIDLLGTAVRFQYKFSEKLQKNFVSEWSVWFAGVSQLKPYIPHSFFLHTQKPQSHLKLLPHIPSPLITHIKPNSPLFVKAEEYT